MLAGDTEPRAKHKFSLVPRMGGVWPIPEEVLGTSGGKSFIWSLGFSSPLQGVISFALKNVFL